MINIKKYACFLFLLLFLIIQFIFIDADTPNFTKDTGAYCDEGFKTLDARNLVLFEKPHWSSYDQYYGWLRISPISVWIHYFAFNLLGVSIEVARLISILFSIGSLYFLYLLTNTYYDNKIAVIVLLLCISNHVFFFFSRLALIEAQLLFYIVLSLYFLNKSKKNKLNIVFVIISLAAAYYTKVTVLIFILSVILYLVLIFKNGYIIKAVFSPNVFFLFLLSIFVVLGLIQYNYDYFEKIQILGRTFRSPYQSFLALPPPEFLILNPLLGLLAFLYIGYIIIKIMENKKYHNADILFATWFVIGIILHSIFRFRFLHYYYLYIFPMVILVVRCLFSLSDIYQIFKNNQNKLLKALILIFCFLYFITFFGNFVYSTFEFQEIIIQFQKQSTILLVGGILISIAIIFYIIFRLKLILPIKIAPVSKFIPIAIFFFIFVVHIPPILSFIINPKYQGKKINHEIGKLEKDKIIIGHWAPQLSINTKNRILVSRLDAHTSTNFFNLVKINPNYLIVVEKIDENYFKEFKLLYNDYFTEDPLFTFEYVGYPVKVYKLNFN